MKKKVLLICIIVSFFCFNSLYARRFAKWFTNMGIFTAEIRYDLMPVTGTNFINLTESNFYDNLIFHRVINGFVIQDGCPNGTGTGGPGYTIIDEYTPDLLHDRAGMLAMAKTSQPNSAGSQYYITLAPTPHLNGNYAVFGKVFEGLDVVLAIGQVTTNSNDKPLSDVVIDSLRMLSLEINEVYPPEGIVTSNNEESTQFIVDAVNVFTFELPQYEWYIDNVLQEHVNSSIFEPDLIESGVFNISCKLITDDLTYFIEWQLNYSYTKIDDQIFLPVSLLNANLYPNPFNEFIQIEYKIERVEDITFSVYDIKGRLVDRDFIKGKKKGTHLWSWSKGSSPSGIYFFEVKTLTERVIVKSIKIN